MAAIVTAALLEAALNPPVAGGGEGVVFSDGFETSSACDFWTSVANPEICNDVDDDCDNVVDLIVDPCYTGHPNTLGIGVCVAGTSTCAAGQWGICEGEVTPSPELCNGLDDDCNGLIDDGCS